MYPALIPSFDDADLGRVRASFQFHVLLRLGNSNVQGHCSPGQGLAQRVYDCKMVFERFLIRPVPCMGLPQTQQDLSAFSATLETMGLTNDSPYPESQNEKQPSLSLRESPYPSAMVSRIVKARESNSRQLKWEKRGHIDLAACILRRTKAPARKTHIIYDCGLGTKTADHLLHFLLSHMLIAKSDGPVIYETTAKGDKFLVYYDQISRLVFCE